MCSVRFRALSVFWPSLRGDKVSFSPTVTRLACENMMLHLECSPDSRINVTDAMYGRQNAVSCPHAEMSDTDCNYDKSLEWVQERCQDRSMCSLSHPLKDPCGGTFKYLEVAYVCVSKYDWLHSEYTDWLLGHLLVCSISATTLAV